MYDVEISLYPISADIPRKNGDTDSVTTDKMTGVKETYAFLEQEKRRGPLTGSCRRSTTAVTEGDLPQM